MKMQQKCKDNLRGSLTKNHLHELQSLELEISLKLMELFRTSIRTVPEDHVHRQTKSMPRTSESICFQHPIGIIVPISINHYCLFISTTYYTL
ncbi:hypothetical protein O3M35_002507 [Rhynocoris fuscipes]|uniref:Uncharacterized protein n=1 Tax=Rhynocoris fuscipes TaxID=488301 RepID=A0AAW1CKJ9_9HEMI